MLQKSTQEVRSNSQSRINLLSDGKLVIHLKVKNESGKAVGRMLRYSFFVAVVAAADTKTKTDVGESKLFF